MATDRTIIKKVQKGIYRTAKDDTAIATPSASVDQLHEETFVFVNVAGSPLAENAIYMAKKCKVKSIIAMPSANLATAAANYVTGTVGKRDSAGANATAIGAFTTNSTGGAALAAFVATVVTVSTTAGVADIPAGSSLTYALVDNATTTEVAVTVSVTVEYV
jgi:hypothetical protein